MANADTILLLVNTSLVMVCLVMTLVFLRFPLPPLKKLESYRISLRVLALNYLFLASIIIVSMFVENLNVGIFSFILIFSASIITQLFSITLVILYNSRFITKRYLILQLIPIIVFTLLFLLFSDKWGNPYLSNFHDLKLQLNHPTVILRLLFLLFYFFQLIYFSFLILKSEKIYKHNLANYFTDNLGLQLKQLRFLFFLVLIGCTLALISSFHLSQISSIVFRSVYIVFYLVFGLRYIQYPKTIYSIDLPTRDTDNKNDIHCSYPCEFGECEMETDPCEWRECKRKILREKYYLQEKVNIKEMAWFLRIGRTKLSTFINKEEKMNFNSWINTLRIEQAKLLFLENNKYSILQVSEMVGYNEQSIFCKQFKQITGQTASDWRKENASD